ncbi:hypothetical protein [Massilia sp. TSP1-1-2]|uniref:hypothetical protein n=1 Tax=unclassified Massilia TaxID=2609279 RepID=UPI003CF3F0DB
MLVPQCGAYAGPKTVALSIPVLPTPVADPVICSLPENNIPFQKNECARASGASIDGSPTVVMSKE